MGKICQRSPCDRLLAALGRYIHGRPEKKPAYYVVSTYSEDVDETQYVVAEVPLEYCPFCGTRTDDIDDEYLVTKKAKAKADPHHLH